MTAPKRADTVPPLHPLAYHGPVGQMVKALAPTTEADPAGVLVVMLAALGAAAGDGCYFVLGGRRHPPRIWPLLIGPTGIGRKGTAVAVALDAFITPFSSSFLSKPSRGLSSGEGLIEHFTTPEPDPERPETLVAHDKRLIVIEDEFGSVLGRSKREGNTLSETLRGLWDDGSAEVKNRKHNRLVCEGAHLVVVGQVTGHELVERLAERDVAGGLVNRFMPVSVVSPHALPEEPDAPDVQLLARGVLERVIRARPGRYRRSSDAVDVWADVYSALRAEQSGRLADITVRGPAYVMRLALLLAMIDEDREIQAEHLLSAAALWDYVQSSARKVFGTSRLTGLDKLTAALRAAKSLTRDDISTGLFRGNETAEQLDAWLMTLMDEGAVTAEEQRTGKAGRPATRYYWTGRESPLLEAIERHRFDEKHGKNEEIPLDREGTA